jgi:predicted ester cyclase
VETSPAVLVQRFYDEVWNRADEAVAGEILHPNFSFRASLGPVRRGPDGFIEYLRTIHAALADFTCSIEDLIVTDDRAAARMFFRGKHRGMFFDVPATQREVSWAGAAFFTTDGRQITTLWVLGDIDAVKRQLDAASTASFGS